MAEREQKLYQILIVEDNPADALVLEECLKAHNAVDVARRVRTLLNSREVIPFLRSPAEKDYRPDLFVLDCRMPIDGGLTLVELKGDPAFLHVPCVVLTGTMAPEDLCDVYRRGANCCYHKPNDYAGYLAIAGTIVEHWLSRICRPACGSKHWGGAWLPLRLQILQ